MQRIIIHWTAGQHRPGGLDLHHYHFVIDGAGRVHPGRFAVAANAVPLIRGHYAAHTLNCNAESIGVALAAMAGAQAHPFQPGSAPVTGAQLAALATLCRALAAQYAIPVTPRTVLTHAEVQPVLGIAQRGKWDVTWLPGMEHPGPPIATGDRIRALISAPMPAATAPEGNAAGSSWKAGLHRLIGRILPQANRRLA